QVDFADTRLASYFLPADLVHPYLSFSYDALRRVSGATDGNGATTTYYPWQVATEPNAKGVIVDPLGNATTNIYDRFGHLVKSADPLGRLSYKAYDDIGQLSFEADPLLNCTAYTRDVRGNEL